MSVVPIVYLVLMSQKKTIIGIVLLPAKPNTHHFSAIGANEPKN